MREIWRDNSLSTEPGGFTAVMPGNQDSEMTDDLPQIQSRYSYHSSTWDQNSESVFWLLISGTRAE